ncbi:MAG: hypothetical protein MJ078_07675, partial [Clostridia bacterium]|nr:hypothetical protein [Clostridia bacterium]
EVEKAAASDSAAKINGKTENETALKGFFSYASSYLYLQKLEKMAGEVVSSGRERDVTVVNTASCGDYNILTYLGA